MGWKFGIGSIETVRSVLSTERTGVLHARPVVPLMFIEHEPQIAERHERRNVIDTVDLGLRVLERVEHGDRVGQLGDLDAIPVRNLVGRLIEAEDV